MPFGTFRSIGPVRSVGPFVRPNLTSRAIGPNSPSSADLPFGPLGPFGPVRPVRPVGPVDERPEGPCELREHELRHGARGVAGEARGEPVAQVRDRLAEHVPVRTGLRRELEEPLEVGAVELRADALDDARDDARRRVREERPDVLDEGRLGVQRRGAADKVLAGAEAHAPVHLEEEVRPHDAEHERDDHGAELRAPDGELAPVARSEQEADDLQVALVRAGHRHEPRVRGEERLAVDGAIGTVGTGGRKTSRAIGAYCFLVHLPADLARDAVADAALVAEPESRARRAQVDGLQAEPEEAAEDAGPVALRDVLCDVCVPRDVRDSVEVRTAVEVRVD